MKAPRRVALCALLILVVLLGVLQLGAGPLVKGYLRSNGPALIGRPIQVESVSLNPFTGHIRLEQLVIPEPEGGAEAPFVSLREFTADLSMLRLLTGNIQLDDVRLDHLSVNVEQRDTVFNFSDILQFLDAQPESDPLPLVMQDITLSNSELRYRDLLVGSDFQIRDVSLFIPGIDLRNLNTTVGMQLSLDQGGSLHTDLAYDERRQTYRLDLHLADFNLQSLLPYLRQSIALGDASGLFGLDLSLSGSLRHVLNFQLEGRAGIRHFKLVDPEGQPLMQCDSASLDVRQVDLLKNRVQLSRIVLDRPLIHLSFGRDSLDNFSRLLVPAEAAADESAAVTLNGSEQTLRLGIDRLEVNDGTLHYRDESLREEPFFYTLSHVTLQAPSFSLTGINRIRVSAQLGQQGALRFSYEGRLSDQRNMRASLDADSIAFADFSPYTVQMFGNEVSGGTLSLHVQAQTAAGQLTGQTRLVLDDPKVEKKRSGVDAEMNIPFRTGMYLLTDRNNVCDIQFPISGSLDEPRFSYKRMLFSTLGKLLVKVAMSPFKGRRDAAANPISTDELLLDDTPLDAASLDSLMNAERE